MKLQWQVSLAVLVAAGLNQALESWNAVQWIGF